jgi:IS30 family transposase
LHHHHVRHHRQHRQGRSPQQSAARSPQCVGRCQHEPLDPAGHWEGDLIIGKDQGSAIGTLVERQTRMVRLLHLPRRDGQALHHALMTRMADLPPALLRSITWDSHSPWQRGSNENANGLLRDYFPKGADLSAHPPQHLLAVENELNNRPRRILGDRPPAELFAALLASEKLLCCDVD